MRFWYLSHSQAVKAQISLCTCSLISLHCSHAQSIEEDCQEQNLDFYCKSKNFPRVLFSPNFAYAKSCENKVLQKSFSPLLILVNHALVTNFNVANMSFNTIRENKILAKISGFTVSSPTEQQHIHNQYDYTHGPQHEKNCLWGLRTSKGQTSLCIHAV